MTVDSDWAEFKITSGGAKITLSNNPPLTTITDDLSTIKWGQGLSFEFDSVDIQFKIAVDSDQTHLTVVTCHGTDGYSRGDVSGRLRIYIGETEYENDITSDNTGDNTKEFTIPLTGVATVN